MDINSTNNGKFSVIKTSKQFILIINDEIIGPFPNTPKSIVRIYNILNVKETEQEEIK